jgi:hypothetical protein
MKTNIIMISLYSSDQQKLSEFNGITSSTFCTSILDIDAVIPPEAISCDKRGACVVDGIPGGQAALKDILDREGFSPLRTAATEHTSSIVFCWNR